MTTLINRCMDAYEAAAGPTLRPLGIRATIEHLAAELTIAGHRDAAGWLLSQLVAEVIQLRRPTTEEPA